MYFPAFHDCDCEFGAGERREAKTERKEQEEDLRNAGGVLEGVSAKTLAPLPPGLTRTPVLSSHLDSPWQVLVGAPSLP